MSLSAGTELGGYEVLALIGAGGMGEVYRARDSVLKRDVVIKVLPSFISHDPLVGSGKGATLRRFDLSVALRFL